jgi:S-adenosylmethionine synthetase
VERKELGHPDTICDALALNRMYLDRVGAILHYNVDKALLVAGQCTKAFGQGELLRPIELIVGDRATDQLDEPWVGVQIVPGEGMTADDLQVVIREVVETELGRMREFRAELIRGEHPVC